MPRKLRLALSPGWVVLHVVAVALVVAMVLLGRWQLLVSESKHFNLRNFGYALQWWAFAGFVVFMWVRLLRDAVGRDAGPADAEPVSPPEPTVEYRRYRAPQSSDGPPPAADPLHAQYNDYLARLAESAVAEPTVAESAEPGAERKTP